MGIFIFQMISNYRNILEQKRGHKGAIEANMVSLSQEIDSLSQRSDDVKEARRIIQIVAQETQKQLEWYISNLVTNALASVFDDPYKLNLEFSLRRGKTEADLLFTRPDLDEGIKPTKSAGFGAVNIASFALRVALWSLKRPRTRSTFIMDEPFGNLIGESERNNAVIMVKELTNKLGFQLILISDLERFKEEADKVFDVRKHKGVSNVS